MSSSKISLGKFDSSDTAGYDYESLKQDIPVIEDASSVATLLASTIAMAFDRGAPVGFAAAHVYERKGYLSYDALDGQRNTAYGSDDDDVLLQITVRVPHTEVEEDIIPILKAERAKREELALQKQKDELDAKIAALQAERSKL